LAAFSVSAASSGLAFMATVSFPGYGPSAVQGGVKAVASMVRVRGYGEL
jgi:hypothetical protein